MLIVHILSIFPELFSPYLNTSIPRLAQEKKIFSYYTYNLYDFSSKRTRRVDDKPFGGLPGQILAPEPLFKGINFIQENIHNLENKDNKKTQYQKKILNNQGEEIHVHKFYLTPQGEVITQKLCTHYGDIFYPKTSQKNTHVLFLCGHYEGVDERILEYFQFQKISLGSYVLSSGELATLVFLDSIIRLLPGVINTSSLQEESFSELLNGKKEYPQYTRPALFQGMGVPEVLLSGNKKKIETWKKENIF